MNDLPDDIKRNVFGFLRGRDLIEVACVSRCFNKISGERFFWQDLVSGVLPGCPEFAPGLEFGTIARIKSSKYDIRNGKIGIVIGYYQNWRGDYVYNLASAEDWNGFVKKQCLFYAGAPSLVEVIRSPLDPEYPMPDLKLMVQLQETLLHQAMENSYPLQKSSVLSYFKSLYDQH